MKLLLVEPEEELTRDNFIQLLREKISKTNMEMVKADVRPFIKNPGEMDIWSTEYFMHVADMIRFENNLKMQFEYLSRQHITQKLQIFQ